MTDPNYAQPPRHAVIKRPRFNRQHGVAAAKVPSAAASSVVILQVSATGAANAASASAVASVAASKRCLPLFSAAAASAHTLAAKVLIFAATTPYSWLNLA